MASAMRNRDGALEPDGQGKTGVGMNISRWMQAFQIGLAILLGLLVSSSLLVYWLLHVDPFGETRFDSAAWQKHVTDETDSTCYRGGMAHDIRDRLLKQGMFRSEVLELLGKADGYSSENEYQYVLGMCSGFRMDYDVLHIYFDSTGRLTKAQIVQH